LGQHFNIKKSKYYRNFMGSHSAGCIGSIDQSDEAITLVKSVSEGMADGDCPEDRAIAKALLNDIA
jgi:hypothetical protein